MNVKTQKRPPIYSKEPRNEKYAKNIDFNYSTSVATSVQAILAKLFDIIYQDKDVL